MRNLKRALSLALAFVMVMSLMIVGTSAKSYTDSDKIENQAAVEILGEIGVMVGNDDGSFAPDRVVTRAEMAVILTRILYGNNMNVDQFKGLNTFTDVPDWAEGYVNLCASLDIIAGRGNGIFDPDATVTTAEAALMLSRALGYFKNNAEFGNDWALAAVKRATQAGIIGGDMVLAANVGLTRDDVAQMTFNTLTKAVPVQYNEVLDVYYNENQGVIYALEFNYLQTLGYKNFSLVYKSNQQVEYGRPATTWGIGSYVATGSGTASGIEKDQLTADGGLIASKVRMLASDEIITVNNTPTYVYTQDTKEKDIYSDLGADVCTEYSWRNKDGYTWTAYINGEEQDNADVPTKNSSTDYTYTDKGTVTEIYVDDDAATVTVVEINYYLGQVYSVNNGTTTIRTLSNGGKVLDDRTFATEEFDEDEYVVFTVDYNNDEDFYICEMMAPETVTGDVVRVENDKDSDDAYIRLDSKDGDKYYYTADDHMVYDVNDSSKTHPTLNEEYILYMTPAGYVLGFELANEKVPQYLYVTDSDEELNDWVGKVILPDATQPKVDLDNDLDNTTDKFGADEIAWEKNYVKEHSNIDELIWDYSVSSSDVYGLTYVPQLGIDADKNSALYQNHVKGLEINNGKSYVEDRNDSTIFIVDEKTIFVDTMNDVAYTGYTEVPDVEDAELAYVVEDGVAQIVFILDGEIYDANATYFFLTGLGRETEDYDGQDYYFYEDAYVDGQKQELTIAYNALNEGIDSTLRTGVLYKVMKSFEGTDGTRYITEVQVVSVLYPDYVNVGEPQWVGSNAFNLKSDDYSNEVKYTTNKDTQYVLVEREAKDVKEYENAYYNGKVYNDPDDFEWFVNPGRLSNMDEDLPAYVDTLVTVAKADRNNVAELVYIYQITPDINPEQYTVRLVDAAGNFINSDRVEKGQTASIAYTAPAGYEVVLDNAAAKYEDGKVILPNVTANTTIKVTLEKILGEYTLTLKGNLADAEVWNKAGTEKLDTETTTDVNGVKTTTIKLQEGTEVIVKDTDIDLGTYLYNDDIITITTEDQMRETLNGDVTLNNAPADRLYAIHYTEGMDVVNKDSDEFVKNDTTNNILYLKSADKFTVDMNDLADKYIVTSDDDLSVFAAANSMWVGTDDTEFGQAYAAIYDIYLKPVAQVVEADGHGVQMTYKGTAIVDGDYVEVGTPLTVKSTGSGTSAFAYNTTDKIVVSDQDLSVGKTYKMGAEDVTFYAAIKVTLNGVDSIAVDATGDGYTAAGQKVTDGDYLVIGRKLDVTTSGAVKYSTGAPQHLLDTTAGNTYGGTAYTAAALLKDITLSAAAKIDVTSGTSIKVYLKNAGPSGGNVEIGDATSSAVTVYVLPGETIIADEGGAAVKITATTGGAAITENVTRDPNNTDWLSYVVGAIDVTLAE